jgi:hypothetical protein
MRTAYIQHVCSRHSSICATDSRALHHTCSTILLPHAPVNSQHLQPHRAATSKSMCCSRTAAHITYCSTLQRQASPPALLSIKMDAPARISCAVTADEFVLQAPAMLRQCMLAAPTAAAVPPAAASTPASSVASCCAAATGTQQPFRSRGKHGCVLPRHAARHSLASAQC